MKKKKYMKATRDLVREVENETLHINNRIADLHKKVGERPLSTEASLDRAFDTLNDRMNKIDAHYGEKILALTNKLNSFKEDVYEANDKIVKAQDKSYTRLTALEGAKPRADVEQTEVVQIQQSSQIKPCLISMGLIDEIPEGQIATLVITTGPVPSEATIRQAFTDAPQPSASLEDVEGFAIYLKGVLGNLSEDAAGPYYYDGSWRMHEDQYTCSFSEVWAAYKEAQR